MSKLTMNKNNNKLNKIRKLSIISFGKTLCEHLGINFQILIVNKEVKTISPLWMRINPIQIRKAHLKTALIKVFYNQVNK